MWMLYYLLFFNIDCNKKEMILNQIRNDSTASDFSKSVERKGNNEKKNPANKMAAQFPRGEYG